jgi:hypothetical protein
VKPREWKLIYTSASGKGYPEFLVEGPKDVEDKWIEVREVLPGTVTISLEDATSLLDVLEDHMFDSSGEDERNNDDVIEQADKLRILIEEAK